MLVRNDTNTLTTFGTQETAQFKIAPNGKAFRVLIDSIYANKIRAIIRELCTNAYDAHVEAGCADRPFDLALPTLFYPEFRVRDYGVSMSHEDIMGLYSTIFESTKDQDNVAVGKFGLGSKTPFAYTDTFTVTAFKDGVKRLYTAYLRPDGVPEITLMLTENTAEERGLEVSFPVDSDDTAYFALEACELMEGFEVKPNDVNNTGAWEKLLSEDNAPILEGKRWKIRNGNRNLLYKGLTVRQGCVLYPVDASSISGLSERAANLCRADIVIDVPMGEVEVTASRDALSYDEYTQANLRARIEHVTNEVFAALGKEIHEQPTYAKACEKYAEIRSGLGTYSPQLTRLLEKLRYKGRPVRTTVVVSARGEHKIPGHLMMLDEGEVRTGISYRARSWSGKWDPRVIAHAPWQTIYYIEDPLKGRVTHAGLRIREDFIKCYANDRDVKHMVWIKATPGTMRYKRIMVALGRPDPARFVSVNDLPVPSNLPGRTRSGGKVMCKRLAGSVWVDDVVDPEDKSVIFIQTRRDYQENQRHQWNPSDMDKLMSRMRRDGYLHDMNQLYRIPATHAAKIKKAGRNWRPFESVARGYIETKVTEESFRYRKQLEMLETQISRYGVTQRALVLAKNLAKYGDLPAKRGPLRELVQRLRILLRLAARHNSDEDLVRYFRFLCPVPTVDISDEDRILYGDVLEKAVKDCTEKYPLISMCVSSYASSIDGETRKNLLSYINAMDIAGF